MRAIPMKDKGIRIAAAALLWPLTLYQAAMTRYEQVKFKPPGRIVRVEGDRLHVIDSGEGGPAVIMEAGMGGQALDWSLVQPALSGYARTIAYDRAGAGFSFSPGSRIKNRDCEHSVKQLRALLAAIDSKPPYLLVGHSFGGMIVRLFASRYPDEVIGLVLVDAVYEGQYRASEMREARQAGRRTNLRQCRLGYLLSPTGIPRLLSKPVGSRRLPHTIGKTARARGYRNESYETIYNDMLMAERSAEQLCQAAPLPPDMPVIVLSAGRQTEEWKRDQLKLLGLTRRTEHVVVEDSWHAIGIDRPDSIAEAVKRLLMLPDMPPSLRADGETSVSSDPSFK